MAEGFTVSRLQIILEGLTGKFDNALKSSESRLKAFSRSMETVNKILQFGGAATAFYAVKRIIDQLADGYLEIDKRSPWVREYKNIGMYQENIKDAGNRMDEVKGRILIPFGKQLAIISSYWSDMAVKASKAIVKTEDDFSGMDPMLASSIKQWQKYGVELEEIRKRSIETIEGLAQVAADKNWAQVLFSAEGFNKDEQRAKVNKFIESQYRMISEARLANARAIAEDTESLKKLTIEERSRLSSNNDAILSEKERLVEVNKLIKAKTDLAIKTQQDKDITDSETSAINEQKAALAALNEVTERARNEISLKSEKAAADARLVIAKYFGDEKTEITQKQLSDSYSLELEAIAAVNDLQRQGLIYDQEASDKRTEIAKKGAQRRKQIDADAEDEIRRNRMRTAASYVSSTGQMIGALAELSDAYGRHSKKDFERTKKLRYAEAVVNTSAAIVSIWAQGDASWQLKLIQTAAVAAACAAQLKRISDTTYDGGGTATSAAAASAAAGSGEGAQTGGSSQAIPRQTVVVQGAIGGMISVEMLRQVFADAARQGVVIDQIVTVAGRSRAA